MGWLGGDGRLGWKIAEGLISDAKLLVANMGEGMALKVWRNCCAYKRCRKYRPWRMGWCSCSLGLGGEIQRSEYGELGLGYNAVTHHLPRV